MRGSSQISEAMPEWLGQLDRRASILLLVIVAFFMVALGWSWFARIDQVVRGSGKVIPSGQMQVVQNLEGGIVREILVREGDSVERDQVLLRIDDTRFAADYRDAQAKLLGTEALIARLEAELQATPLDFPASVRSEPELVLRETELFHTRQAELESSLEVLSKQVEQRRQELSELESRSGFLARRHASAAEELALLRPLVVEGVSSKVELLRLERSVTELESELRSARLGIPAARAAVGEAKQRVEERRSAHRAEALEKLTQAKLNLSTLKESLTAMQDRVARRDVRSPVAGTVNQLLVNTVGGVVQPGMDLAEVVPREDSLMVEARIAPSDIAFLWKQQTAVVKFTAYDFAIYGGLDAQVDHISPDTISDEHGNSFYQVRVRTRQSHLGRAQEALSILPGMVAEVDFITGQRTVLQYLLKPVFRAKERALRER